MFARCLLALTLARSVYATEPDDATRRWWSHIQALANDSMAGRETGTEEYRKASRYVAAQFERAGLKPAGENGSYFQTVPMHSLRQNSQPEAAVLTRKDGSKKLLFWRRDIAVVRAGSAAGISGELVFAGSGTPPGDLDLKGKILVRLGAPVGTAAANRTRTAVPLGIAATLDIDNFDGPERRRWPVAYSGSVSLAGSPSVGAGLPAMSANPGSAEALFDGSGHTYAELKAAADAGKSLPWFGMQSTLSGTWRFAEADLKSDNVIAVLPGADPALGNEYVVVSAHLDGYGIGEPINGDKIYNGAFDDAAYVATLIDFAQALHDAGTHPRRSILFLVVTGEEKGLLGSHYYAAHLTVPKEQIVADVNLDQLRPIFPLKTLTMLALDQSTLGDTAKAVASSMSIRIQPDPEPERNLLRRSDHYPFLQMGIPATGFIFGYEQGSPEEVIYRRWYADRYHSPADDLNQPWDPKAAAQFNEFFGRFVLEIANASRRPTMLGQSR